MDPPPTERRSEPRPSEAAPFIPNHRLLRRIGQGSFGEVWLALDALGKWTAVKIVYGMAYGPDGTFEREFRGLRDYEELARRERGLMAVRNVGVDVAHGFFHYSMELADDARTRAPLPNPPAHPLTESSRLASEYVPWTLSEELRRRGQCAPEDCLRWGASLAGELECLHAGGLLHRDIKPSNIVFIDGQPKLADVGLVSMADASVRSHVGTAGFVPLHGANGIPGDLYALGKVLYCMSTGRPVEDFPRDPPDPDPPADSRAGRHRSELRAICDRACEPHPRLRYKTATRLREDLELLLGNRSVLRLRRFESLYRRARLVSLILVPILVLVLAGLLMEYRRAREADRARLAQLENRKLSRIQDRRAGWSATDWQSARAAARQRGDPLVLRQAIATLSGMDASLTSHWRGTPVSSAAFGPDGRLLLAGYGDEPAWLFQEDTTRHPLPLVGDGRPAWTHSGDPVLLRIEDQSFVLRNAISRERLGRYPFQPGEAAVSETGPVFALSPDGALAAGSLSRSGGSRLVVWETRTGRERGVLPESATALSFSPDAQWLAAGQHSGSILVLRLDPFEIVWHLPAAVAPSPVQALAFGEDARVPWMTPSHDSQPFSPRRPWLLAAGHRGTGIVVWDLTSGLPRSFARGATWEVTALACLPDRTTLASAGRMGVRYWDIATGQPLLWTLENSGRTRALAVSPDGTRVVSGTTGEHAAPDVCLWAIEPHRGIQRLRGLTASVRHVDFSHSGHRIAALSDEWRIGVWDIPDGRLLRLFDVPPGDFADGSGVALDPDGLRLAYARSADVTLFDIESGRATRQWTLPPARAYSSRLAFRPDGILVLARVRLPERQGEPRRWEMYRLDSDGTLPIVPDLQQTDDTYSTKALTLDPTTQRLVLLTQETGRSSDGFRIVHTQTAKTLWRTEFGREHVWHVLRVDPLGQWAAVPGWRPALSTRLVALSDGSPGPAIGDCIALGPGGNAYATHLDNQGFVLLRATMGKAPDLPIDSDSVLLRDSFLFSSDGNRAGWGCTDGTVGVAEIVRVKARLDELLHLRPRPPP
ncbi:MAG: hypothetical protein KF833_12120 [Verrucomicrobiae bacterium]|nr:hypothetical protein [Verrucomicrobiae bacterium]